MSIINYRTREINCKIVYYGPGFCGKTTNIEGIHAALPERKRGHLQTIDTEGDRTLFFEQFTVTIGDCGGMSLRFLTYGVPGQSYYKSTRKVVLQGCDGIVFVADSSPGRLRDNIESLKDMHELLAEHQLDAETLPLVIQYNKRDVDNPIPVEELEAAINQRGVPSFEAVAVKHEGIQETFKAICKLVIDRIGQEYRLRS